MYKKELAQKKQNSKTNKSKALAGLMALTLVVGGVSAYFTDADTVTNTLTVGNVSIELQEPNWEVTNNITPGQEMAKDPKIYNDGINDAFVFMSVEVPYAADVVCADEDGTKLVADDTELFAYDVNAGWIELTDYMVKNEETKTVTHLYAYATDDVSTTKVGDAMTALSAENTTATLFDQIRFANVVEDQNIETTTQNIVVKAYGIQTDNIGSLTGVIDGDNEDGTVIPSEIWDILIEQSSTLNVNEK